MPTSIGPLSSEVFAGGEPASASPALEPAIAVETEFDDVRLMLRRWQAARVGDVLPPYEEMTLGSIGRFADEVAVIRRDGDANHCVLRAGQRFRTVVGLRHSSQSLGELPHVFTLSIGSAIDQARSAREPRLAVCRWLVDGKVSTIEIIALPLSCRWPGEYFLLFLRPRKSQFNLAKLLINSTQEGIVALSPIELAAGTSEDFCILSINEAAARFLGSTVDTLQFTLLSDALRRIGIRENPAVLARAVAGGRLTNFELAYELAGSSMVLQVGVAVADGVLAVTLTDVRDLKARETLFRSLFHDNPAPMYVRARGASGFLDVNEAALRLYGHARSDFLARALADIRIDGAEDRESVSRHRTADGRIIDVIEYAREIMVDGAPAVLSTIVDITERKRTEAHVTYLAHHDPLTGISNRTVFTRELERAAGGLARDNRGFGVILVDLDDFKTVNDTLGHAAGDALLIEAATRLRNLVRRSDVVARLGGDEFAILLPNAGTRREAEGLATRILHELASIQRIEGAAVSVGASIGVALAPDDAVDTEELLRCADLALYRAKESGRGTFRFFEREMDRQHRERRALEMELRAARIESEFEVHYQPIVAVKTGRLRGFEALLRWRNPRRGLVSPADFIPIAEETGMIDDIGRWVLLEACRQAAAWPAPLVVAVNVSPVQFRKGELVDTVDMALALTGLEPGRIEIEITETVLLADTSANLATLSQLRGRGVRVALDDFGTGYSSLSYVRRFPFNRLKIDRSFVREIDESPESLAIVRAIIGLGASLGIDTTAEGVETVAQLEALRNENCGELQGYLFSPPVARDDVAGIIGAFFDDVSLVA
ncbi:putative bifunctional diguanylate cyclase/phosphodiesterase [Mesorhizobium sp. L-8-10]|uniref:putative bifunctional diguanylate cyclase/phosphodiesterase n=1 Tax=Mesorhizobium sp. L-8-10 TaxID=2744523 RepID=UPI0019252AB8|nr:EAL domain-containing protein [Mesorhizobium sp. L-8-10]